MKSDSIKELATALSKAQGEIEGAKKDSNNPFFKSNYADLASVWDACRKALVKNGLSIVQAIDVINVTNEPVSGELCYSLVLRTTLMHASGEWMESVAPLRPVKDDPQSLGSCISYMRRYALAAMVGVFQVDDDANAATHTTQPQPPTSKFNINIVSDAQLKRLHAISNTANWSIMDVKKELEKMGLQQSNQLNRKQYDEICNLIEKNPKNDNIPH